MSRLSLAFAAALFAVSANAATLYVAPSGNDGNAGSLAAPFRTITKAASMARPGDVVEARGGVYNEVVKISARGTAAARITVRSYAGETAVIDGTGTAAGTDLVQLGSSEYLDFSGFEVRNSTRLGVAGWGARNVRFTNNRVHHALKGGVYFGFSASGSTYDLVIEGNEIYNNCVENQYHTMAGGWGQSLGIQYADRVRVANNRIHSNDGEGVGIIVTDNALVEGNDVFDNYSVGIYLDNAQFTTVNANHVYSTGDSRYYRSGLPAAGIGAANESYSVQNPLTDIKVTNNIVSNTRWGFYYGAYELGGGLKNATVSNNTFYKSTAAMVWLEADSHSNNVVQNNIFLQSGGGVMFSGSASGTAFRNNNWYGGNAGAAASTGDVIVDPQLANAGGVAAADYKLTASSPIVHAALATTLVTTDYFGTLRTGALDIGAHQLSGATSPTAPPPPPPAPAPAPAPTADTTAPTVPAGLWGDALSRSAIDIGWTAATDNVGVTGYMVYRNGVHVGTTASTVYHDTGLARSTAYTYSVVAMDAAGNKSAASAPITHSTHRK